MVVGVLTVLRNQRERAMYSNILGGFGGPLFKEDKVMTFANWGGGVPPNPPTL